MLNMIQQGVLVVKKDNGILGSTMSSFAFRFRQVILPLCSALLRPHLEHSVCFWALQCKRDLEMLGRV